MRTHHSITLLAADLLALTSCSKAVTSEPKPDDKVAASPSASQSSLAPEAVSSAAAAAGIPPSPAPEQRAIYLAVLNKIDPASVVRVHARQQRWLIPVPTLRCRASRSELPGCAGWQERRRRRSVLW